MPEADDLLEDLQAIEAHLAALKAVDLDADDPWEQVGARIADCQSKGGVYLNFAFIKLRDVDFAGPLFGLVVAKLPNLESLDLTETKFGNDGVETFAKHAVHLGSLKNLYLGGTQVGLAGLWALFMHTEHLGGLRLLDISFTRIGDVGLKALAEQVKHLGRLRILNLSGSRIGDDGLKVLAEHAEHLGNLSSLDLSYTQVGDRGLKALADRAEELGKLKVLYLSHTQVNCVAPEVLKTNDARAIFAALKGKTVAEAKVVVLGEPWVGKSWLCERFFEGTIPTKRIQTRDFELIRPKWKPKVGNRNIDLHVWDFGGQHILHGMHEMFLSQRSVCLLVLDIAQKPEEDGPPSATKPHGNRLTFWMSMIRHFLGPYARVILVITKCDEENDPLPSELPEWVQQLDGESLKKQFHFEMTPDVVLDFSAKTKLKDDHKLDRLREAITNALDSFEELREGMGKIGPELRSVKERVEKEFAKRDEKEKSLKVPPLVSLSEYRTWCVEAGVTDSDQQEGILHAMHNFGSAFFFGQLKSDADERARLDADSALVERRRLVAHRDDCLNDWLINPRWLKGPVYEVMQAAKEEPLLTDADIQRHVNQITSEMNFQPHDKGATVVRAMLEFTELCLRVDRNRQPNQTAANWLFPHALRYDARQALKDWGWEECNTVTWLWSFSPKADDSDSQKSLPRQSPEHEPVRGFFPPSIMHRFLVRAFEHHEVVGNSCWPTGALLEINGIRGVVEGKPEFGEVTVRLRKTNNEEQARLNEEFVNWVRVRLEDLIVREPDRTEPLEMESSLPAASSKKPKRYTERGAGRLKLIAALTQHHNYGKHNEPLTDDPIGSNDLARWAKVGVDTANRFFNKLGEKNEKGERKGGYARYLEICADKNKLLTYLKKLNDEYANARLYGRSPPSEGKVEDK